MHLAQVPLPLYGPARGLWHDDPGLAHRLRQQALVVRARTIELL